MDQAGDRRNYDRGSNMTAARTHERRRRLTINVGLSIVVVIAAVAIGGLLVLASHANPLSAYSTIFSATFGTPSRILYTLSQSAPLIIVSLGLLLAFKGRFWNGGGEGQILLGAIFGIAATHYADVGFMPLSLAIGFTAAFVAAGSWALVSGALKVWFKVDDIVSTLLLSQVAGLVVDYLVRVPFTGPNKIIAALSSFSVPASAVFPSIGGLNGVFIFAIALSVFMWIIMARTKFGFKVKIMGTNPDTAAAYFGRGYTNRLFCFVSFLSGGLIGVGGMTIASAFTGNMIVGSTSGAYAAGGFTNSFGFIGIAIVFLAGLDAIAVIPAAIFFVSLVIGGLGLLVVLNIPSDLTLTITGIAMLFVAARVPIVDRLNKIRLSSHGIQHN